MNHREQEQSDTTETLRLFVAILLPESWLALLGDVQHDLREAGLRLRYVRPEGIHLTLKFLGETPAGRVSGIEAVLAEAAAGVRPFSLRLGGLGTFGPTHHPRVVWAGLDGDRQRLGELSAGVERALHRIGVPHDVRSFNPHLTLARVPEQMPSVEAARIAPMLEERSPLPAQEHRVDSFALMWSELGPGGARYTVLNRWRLVD
jgi:2'-5' RNA ligase